MPSNISMKAMLESGVHFGHRTNKWDPHMKPFIFTERNGIHIIDLQQTVKSLNTAYDRVRDTVMNGGVVLFIGTKRQAQETIRDEAIRCGMPYVTERWLGGMLTNWTTISQRIAYLEKLEKMRDGGEFSRLTKKEALMLTREIKRLETRLSGIRTMKQLPNLVFVIDVDREATAIHEANLRNIPVIALVDTNCNPNNIDMVIPSNDDAIRAIKLLVGKMADAAAEGRSMRKDEELSDEKLGTDFTSRSRPTPARPVAPFEDFEDGELLGDATLAKLTVPVQLGKEPIIDADLTDTEEH